MRLLCLHGRYQCGAKLASMLGLGSRCSPSDATAVLPAGQHELAFVNAPILVDSPPIRLKTASRKRNHSGSFRVWWGTEDEDISRESLHLALGTVREAVERYEARGLVGFSQGAALVSLLCSAAGREALGGWEPRCAVLFSGYAPRLENGRWREYLDVPSLHFVGERDQVVHCDRSLGLSEAMGGRLRMHQRGHGAALRQFNSELLDFVDECS